MRTRLIQFARKFALQAPVIIQAPMAGGITTPHLVASVSNAYALGSYATGYLKTDQVKEGIKEIKRLTDKPFIVNLFVPSQEQKNLDEIRAYQQSLNKFRRELGLLEESDIPTQLMPSDNFYELVDVLLHEKIKIVSFTFGNLPADVIQAFKKTGTYLIGTATSLEEAKILADSGIDAIVAQGAEAGGHRGSFFTPVKESTIGTMALVPLITSHLDLPVVAAGGIVNGKSIVAATALGAAAVQMGTAFLTTKESGADQTYKNELVKMKHYGRDMTTLTKAYSGKMARGINTDFIRYMESHVRPIPSYPIPHLLSSPVRKEAVKQKVTNIMSMWSGQGVPLIDSELKAEELLKKLRDEVSESLQELTEFRELKL